MATTVLNTKISEVINKISNTSNLVTTNVLNTKINEVENKISYHDKQITTPKFNKLIAERFVARLKQANLVTEADSDNKLTILNRPITANETKNLEDQKKLDCLITNGYKFSLGGMNFTSNDGSQNMFFYQRTLDTFELKKKDKGTDYVLNWKSNKAYNFKLKPLYTAFLHSIKVSGYRIKIKFDKDPLAVEQYNYLSKIVNVSIVYDLHTWSRNPTNNF